MKRCLQFVAVLSLLVMATSNAHAVQTSTTLDVLINNNWWLQAGDKRLDRFYINGGVAASNFALLALNDGGQDPGPGVRFNVLNNALEVFDDDSASVTIGFRVSVLNALNNPDQWIKDTSLTLANASVIGDEDQAGVSITERVGLSKGANDLGNLYVQDFDPGSLIPSASTDFDGSFHIWVEKRISVFADDEDDYANLLSFEQRFSQEVATPEPVTAGLGMMGLAALALAATRRRRA